MFSVPSSGVITLLTVLVNDIGLAAWEQPHEVVGDTEGLAQDAAGITQQREGQALGLGELVVLLGAICVICSTCDG